MPWAPETVNPASCEQPENWIVSSRLSGRPSTFMRFMTRVCWLLVFSIGYSQLLLAQGNHDKIAAAVDEVFADVVKPGSPGCAVAVARDGKLLYAKGYGLANIEENIPLTPESVFDIGSTSKQFSAASILLLQQQGKLSVNDDIRKYIPELPDYGKKITILNLLNHTSGLRDYLVLFDLAGVNTDSVTTDEEALALITRQKALEFRSRLGMAVQQYGFLPVVRGCETHQRTIAAGICRGKHFSATEHEPYAVSRLAHIAGSESRASL